MIAELSVEELAALFRVGSRELEATIFTCGPLKAQKKLLKMLTQAQAAGLPVVASDVGGTREGVEVGQSALLVPSRDPRALADAVAQVAADGALRRRMGEAGVAFVREHFSLERYLDRTEEIYRQVLANA